MVNEENERILYAVYCNSDGPTTPQAPLLHTRGLPAWPGLASTSLWSGASLQKKLIQSNTHLYNAHGVSSKSFLATTM